MFCKTAFDKLSFNLGVKDFLEVDGNDFDFTSFLYQHF